MLTVFAAPCTFVQLQPRSGTWQSARLVEVDLGVLKYGRMQLKDLPRFDGVILCYDSLVPASYEALPNLMGGSSSSNLGRRHRSTFHMAEPAP
jgi:hypothetical protein